MLFCNIVRVPPSDSEAVKGFGYFSDTRLEKLSGIKHFASRMRSCSAELAICLSLRDMGIVSAKPIYHYSSLGKPLVPRDGLFISVSHSGEYSACVAADYEIAVDIEKVRVFKPAVENYIRNVSDSLDCGAFASRDEYLTVLWTIKEARLKLSGEGISGIRMNRLEIKGDRVLHPDSADTCRRTTMLEQSYWLSLVAYSESLLDDQLSIEIYDYSQVLDILGKNNK